MNLKIQRTKYLRVSIATLGFIGLTALFLKLPAVSTILIGACPLCASDTLFWVLAGSGYFSFLIALTLLFKTSPPRLFARIGLGASLTLATILFSFKMPSLCILCLVAHLSNIAIWSLWCLNPKKKESSHPYFGTKQYLAVLAPLSLIAFFSFINFTVPSYTSKRNGLYTGDPTPLFIAQTVEGNHLRSKDKTKTILNFVMPQCPHCEEQLQILDKIVQNSEKEYRVLELQKIFKIHGSPTLYIWGSEGRISRVILGIPDGFKETLERYLPKGKASS